MSEIEKEELLKNIAKEVSEINKKGEKRDEMIKRIEGKIEQQGSEIKRIEGKIEQQGSEIKRIEEKIEQQGSEIKRIEEKMNKKFEKQRLDMVNLEFTITDKIEALFDVREMNLDKFEQYDKDLTIVNRMLDRHEARISKLEKIG